MKRTLLGGAAALLIVYLFVSWRIGFAIEKQVNQPLEQLKGKTPYVDVVANTFRRGWFVSEQDLTVELFRHLTAASPGAGLFSAPIQIKIHNVIWHGPICGLTCIGLARVRSHVSFGPPLGDYLSSAFGSVEPLHSESRMGFGGGGSATISSPAIRDTALSHGARIGWGGFELIGEVAPDYSSYSLRGSMPRLFYASPEGGEVEFDDMNMVAHSKRALRSVFQGESSLAIGRMSFSAKAGGAVISNLRGSYQSAVSDGYMNLIEKISFGTITASSLNFSGAHFDFSLSHLDVDSLEQLSAAAQKVNQDATLPSEQRSSNLLAAVKQPGIALLSHSPQFILERFSIATGSGEASLSGTVSLKNVAESDFGEGADPKAVIQKLEADLDLSIDDAFINGLPQGANLTAQLQSFADKGLATHANGKFHTKIAFHQGVTTFDGKSLPQPQPPQSQPPPAVRPPRR
jgi:uncharacterized protein YdgA (DUF945 family)